MSDRLAKELREIRQSLEEVGATLRFLMAVQLVKDGHAKNLREASRITNDPARLAELYPVPGAKT